MFKARAGRAIAAALTFGGAVLAGGASAQSYPGKPVVIINPNVPGGAIEILARRPARSG